MEIIEANGARIPALGFGTWTLRGKAAEQMVEAALAAGFRHVDTAQSYGNEIEVGRGIQASGVPREEVVLTTKIWPDEHAPEAFLQAAERSVDQLGTVPDLLLLHWPSKTVATAATIEAAARAVERGFARHVGVSNYTTTLLAEALRPGVPLVCNQVEYHPFLDQTKVREATRAAGMALVAYCPLARGRIREEPVAQRIAERHGVTPEQVALAWLLAQDGVGAIPRTSKPTRLAENLAAAEIELTPEEIREIDALNGTQYRIADYDFSPTWDAA